jgi:hypothetical protein
MLLTWIKRISENIELKLSLSIILSIPIIYTGRKLRPRDLKNLSNSYINLETDYKLVVPNNLYCVFLYTTLPNIGMIDNYLLFFQKLAFPVDLSCIIQSLVKSF